MPTQSVGAAMPADLAPAAQCAIAPSVLEQLWVESQAEACGLARAGFEQILLRIGIPHNFGVAGGPVAEITPAQQAAFFAGLRIADLVLARACAGGAVHRALSRGASESGDLHHR